MSALNPYEAPKESEAEADRKPRENEPPSGFLVVTMLLGVGSGFAPFDFYAGSNGHDWQDRYYINQTLLGIVIGGVIGLAAGWVLDATVTIADSRRRLVLRLWTLLLFGFILFLFFQPAFQNARE